MRRITVLAAAASTYVLRYLSCLTLAFLPSCVAAQQTAARDYYNELLAVL